MPPRTGHGGAAPTGHPAADSAAIHGAGLGRVKVTKLRLEPPHLHVEGQPREPLPEISKSKTPPADTQGKISCTSFVRGVTTGGGSNGTNSAHN